MTFKKIAVILCVLCPLIICSCEMMIEYTFINKSSYNVNITLSEPYKYEDSDDASSYTSSFSVYKGSQETVYVKKNDVDFKWTTDYAGDNSKVYCTTDGSKATFLNH